MIKVFLVFIALIVLFYILYIKTLHESFNNFRQYQYNNIYYFGYNKNKDNEMLQNTLKKWEIPFNNHNEGYYNLEEKEIHLLNPIYTYTSMNDL